MIDSQLCMVCHGRKNKNIYSGILKKCLDCGFITANLDVNEVEFDNLYSKGYFKDGEYHDYVKDKLIIQKNFIRRVRYLLKKIEQKNIKTVLEIGCAYGFFGEVLRSFIPEAKYLGLDISDQAIKYASDILKLNAVSTDYLNFKNRWEYTDVFMWDVIEHLPRPDLILEKVHSDIIPGGRLFITTGDIGTLIPRIRKEKWRMIHPPSHLHYFSRKTLCRLLDNKGFKVSNISYPAIYRGIKQIIYSIFILGKNPGKLIQNIYNQIPNRLNIPINTLDIIFVIATRE